MTISVKIDSAILITFVVGVISTIYFITIVSLIGSDPALIGIPGSYLSWMIIERLVLTGIIIVVLIMITYILLRQKGIEELQRMKTVDKAKQKRSEKEIKEDLRRYYRDLGALKIVFKDGALDSETYMDRKKYLDEIIKIKKKQLEKFKK